MGVVGINEKENCGEACGVTPRMSPSGGRKFGTSLSTNTKVVRVRRTPKSKSSNVKERMPQPSFRQPLGRERTLLFSPGAVGLQLEQIEEDPKYGCRVVRFVDGGPKFPGQARKSGLIKPGDLVLHVEAEGIVETTYEGIIGTLKKTDVSRMIGFQSVWDASFLEAQTSLTFQPSERSPANNKATPIRSSRLSPLMISTPESVVASIQPLKSQNESSIHHYAGEDGAKTTMPPLPLTSETKPKPKVWNWNTMNSPVLDSNIIKSPSDLILLSTYLPKSQNPTTGSEKHSDPIIVPTPTDESNRCSLGSESNTANLLSDSGAPPLTDEKVVNTCWSAQDGISASDTLEGVQVDTVNYQTPTQVFTNGKVTTIEDPSLLSQSQTTAQRNDIQLKTFSPSNVKRLFKKDTTLDSSPSPRTHSLLLGNVYNKVGPAFVNSSYAIGEKFATKFVPAVASSSYGIGAAVRYKLGKTLMGYSTEEFEKATAMKLELLIELSRAKAALDVQDTDKEELKQKMEALFRENISLRAAFEEKLNSARMQHAKGEHEMKAAHRQAQSRQDSRIRELEDCNLQLKEELVVSKLAMDQDTELVASLEREIVSLSNPESGRSEQESDTADLQEQVNKKNKQLRSKHEDYICISKKMNMQEEDWHMEVLDLQTDNARLQEDSMNLRMEVEMARALIQETEMRIMELEGDNMKMVKQLESMQLAGSASRETYSRKLKDKDEQMENTQDEICSLKEEIDTKNNEIKSSAKQLHHLSNEKRSLEAELTSAEAKIESLNESVGMATDQLRERGERIKILQLELNETNKKLEDMRKENDTLRSNEVGIGAIKAECDGAVQDLMKTLQDKEEALYESRILVDNLQGENAQTTKDLMEAYANNYELAHMRSEKEQELKIVERELFEVRTEATKLHHEILDRIERGEASHQSGSQPTSSSKEYVLHLSDKLISTRRILFSSLVKIRSLEDDNKVLAGHVRKLTKALGDAKSQKDEIHNQIEEAENYAIALSGLVLKFRGCIGCFQFEREPINAEQNSNTKSLERQLSWILEEMPSGQDEIESYNESILQTAGKIFLCKTSQGDTVNVSQHSQCDDLGFDSRLGKKVVECGWISSNVQAGKTGATNLGITSYQSDCKQSGCGRTFVSHYDLSHHLRTVLSFVHQARRKSKSEEADTEWCKVHSLNLELMDFNHSRMELEQERSLHEIKRLDSTLDLLRSDKRLLEEKIELLNRQLTDMISRHSSNNVMFVSIVDEITSERDLLLLSNEESERQSRELRAKILTLSEEAKESAIHTTNLEQRIQALLEENSFETAALTQEIEELRSNVELNAKERAKHESDKAEMKKKISDLICDNESLSQDLELKEYELQSASNDLDTEQEHNFLLSAESGCLYSKVNALENQSRAAERESMTFKELLSLSQSEKSDLAKRFVLQINRSKALEVEVEELRSHEGHLEEELRAVKQSRFSTLVAMKDLDTRLERMHEESIRLKTKLCCFEIRHQRLITEKENLEEQGNKDIVACKEYSAQLEINFDSMQSENNRCQKRICCFDLQNHALVTSRQLLEGANIELKTKLEVAESNQAKLFEALKDKFGEIQSLEACQQNYLNEIYQLVHLITGLRVNNESLERQRENHQLTEKKLASICKELRSKNLEIAENLTSSEVSRRKLQEKNEELTKDLSRLKEAETESQECLDRLCRGKEVLVKEHEMTVKEMNILKSDLESNRLHRQELQRSIDEYRSLLDSQRRDHEQKVRELAGSNMNLRQSETRLFRVLFQANARIVCLTVQNKSFRSDNIATTAYCERAERETERLENKVRELEDLYAKESEGKNKAVHDLEQLEDKVHDLNASAETVSFEAKKTKASFDERETINRRQLAILSDELANTLKEKEIQEAKLFKVQADFRIVREQMQQYKNDICEMDANRQKLVKALIESEDTISDLRRELLTVQDELSGDESDDDSIDSEVRRLTKGELAAECLSLQDDVAKAEAEIFKLSGELNTQRQLLANFQEKFNQKDIEGKALFESNTILEDRLRQMVEQTTFTEDNLNRRINEMEKELDGKGAEVTMLTLELEQLYQKSRSQGQHANHHIAELKMSYAAVRAECVVTYRGLKLLQKRNQLTEEHSLLLDKKHGELEHASECMRAEIFELNVVSNRQQRTISDLNEKIAAYQTEKTNLLSEIDILRSGSEEKGGELFKLQKINSTLLQSIQSLAVENDVMKCQAKEKDSLMCSLEKKHEDLNSRFVALVSKEKQVQQQFDEQEEKKSELELKASGLDCRIALLADENGGLNSRLESLNSANLDLKEEISVLEEERVSLSAELDKIREELKRKEARGFDLEKEIPTLQSENASLLVDIDELRSKVQRKDSELVKLHKKELVLDQCVTSLSIEKDALIQEKDSMIRNQEEKLLDLNSRLSTLVSEGGEIQKQCDDQVSTISELGLKVSELENKNSLLSSEKDELILQVEAQNAAELGLKKEIIGLQETKALISAKCDKLQEQAEGKVAQTAVLISRVSSLTRKYESLSSAINGKKLETCSIGTGNGALAQPSGSPEPCILNSKSRSSRTHIAGALLCMALDKRRIVDKSSIFRKWFCNASTMKAISSQKRTAAALAQQLEITREKLVILKAHLKKGRHVQSVDERKQPRFKILLDRIEEQEGMKTLHDCDNDDDKILEI